MKSSCSDLLQTEFRQRQSRNSRYSLRAFAADIRVSPAQLSMVLTKKRHLTESRAREICAFLDWPEERQQLFCASARLTSQTSEEARRATQSEIDLLVERNKSYNKLRLDTFKTISKWYHMALIELTRLPSFSPQPRWIAKRLGISEVEASLAIDRLERTGLLTRENTGKWSRTNPKIELTDVPSEHVRSYHKGVLLQAAKTLDQQDFETRDFGSMSFAVNSKKIPEAKKRLKKFLKDMNTLMEGGNADAVYQLSYQLFRVDKP